MTGGGYRWIDRAGDLAAAVERWSGAAEVAFDTEFLFERTFRPRLGLVQIAAANEVALLDPLALPDLEPLGALLAAAAIDKVAHAVAGDLTALQTRLEGPVAPLLDTQIAAAFCGLGGGLSYAALVQAVTGIELGKHETRTDWLRRPLSSEQLRYAAEDVAHLPVVAAELRRRLAALGRLDWALEESRESARAAVEQVEPEAAWSRLRGLERLPPRGRRVARALAAWREREARRLDLARPFLMRDETLIALATTEALAPQAIGKLPGFDPRRHEVWIPAWREALTAALTAAEQGDKVPVAGTPTKSERALGKTLAELASGRAAALQLPVDLLLSRRTRERLVAARSRGEKLAGLLTGWRAQVLNAELARLDR